MSHTPGPWTNHSVIVTQGPRHSAIIAKTLIARVYSEAFGDVVQEKANADLIASAPDLLAALRECEAALDGHISGPYVSALKNARAAIAKAEGIA